MKSTVVFSPCAHTNLINFAKTSPFLSVRKKAEKPWWWRVVSRGYSWSRVNKWWIRRCNSVIKSIQKHGRWPSMATVLRMHFSVAMDAIINSAHIQMHNMCIWCKIYFCWCDSSSFDNYLPYPALALPHIALAQSATLLLPPCFRWLRTWLAVGKNLPIGHSRFLHFLLFETALSDTNTVTNSRYDGMGSTPIHSTSLQSDPLAWYCLYSI